MNFEYESGIDVGDSGDDPGEVSDVMGESKVETVVVGEESADPDVTEETLSRCWKGRGRRDVLTVTLVGSLSGWICGCCSSFPSEICDSPPNTDINDGNESGSDGGLV
jgi:hypothetical protein